LFKEIPNVHKIMVVFRKHLPIAFLITWKDRKDSILVDRVFQSSKLSISSAMIVSNKNLCHLSINT